MEQAEVCLMLGGSYTPDAAEVRVEPGWGGYADAGEAWAAGLRSDSCFTAVCGSTWLVLAPERGGPVGHWQVVWDHVDTWAEALAIWRRLGQAAHLVNIRALPSARLRALPLRILKSAVASMASQGWELVTGDEWVLRRVVPSDIPQTPETPRDAPVAPDATGVTSGEGAANGQ
ncbi:hypothetical protein [Tateyamaria sp.]|uniref:hypothetical protein n=1 Tax=Tateyamaria sp. TaxID=1929288 RepID=UPI003B2272C6